MNESDAQPDIGSLCLSCGMCCSGLLYPQGSLDADEVAQAIAAGLEVVPAISDFSQSSFAQPCGLLDRTVCRGYATWRPKVCASYHCKLANGVRGGEIALAEAEARIVTVQELQAKIAPLLHPGETWPEANQRWSSGKLDRTESPEAAQLHLLLTALNLHLDRHFRRNGERTVGERIASQQTGH